jgi:SagB-type dehydrogenase family enzyme
MNETTSTERETAAGAAMRWASLHVYCHSETDRLLREGVAPAIAQMRAEGALDGWFFMRYWHGGPHVRLRLRGTEEGVVAASRVVSERLRRVLRHIEVPEPLDPEAFYAGFRHQGDLAPDETWHPHGTVVERDYEPELERYGGVGAMAATERLFELSSEVALAVIAGTADEQARNAVAIDLIRGLVAGAYPNDGAAQVTWLREYATMWQFLDAAVERNATAIRSAAEATFVRSAAQLAGPADGELSPLARTWCQAVRRFASWLREQDALTSTPDAVLVSHLHMTANRLGLTASDEFYLAWLTSFAIAAPPPAEGGYFADAADAPDRAYLELSKFRGPTMRSQAPKRTGPVGRELEFARGDAVDLPVPVHRGLGRPFAEVLAARRSHRVGYGGGVPFALGDLAALLGYGTGFIAEDLTEDEPRGVRAHPSAGRSYATFVRVVAFDVAGIDPGVYEYLPVSHQLQRVGPSPGRDDLLDSSPFFFRGDSPAIQADAAPVFLAICAGLGVMRERYGLRALRFVDLEMGHLAQNVLLTATSLGLPSVPVGGFYDDHLAGVLGLDGYADVVAYLIPVGPPAPDAEDARHLEES